MDQKNLLTLYLIILLFVANVFFTQSKPYEVISKLGNFYAFIQNQFFQFPHQIRLLQEQNVPIPIQYITGILSGQWKSQKQIVFNFFNSMKGNVQVKIYVFENSKYQNYQLLKISFLDPKYIDDKIVITLVNLTQFHKSFQNNGYQNNITLKVYRIDKLRILGYDNCSSQVILKNSTYPQYQLIIKIISQQCNIHVNIQLSKKVQTLYYLGLYCLYLIIPLIISSISAKSLINYFSTAHQQADRLSIKSLLLIIYLEIWICLMHVYEGLSLITDSYYGLILVIIGSMWFFIGVGLCMKLIVMVWRTRLSALTIIQIRREIISFYLKFYLGSFVYFIMMYLYIFQEWFMILQSLYLLPQIIRNIYRGNQSGFYFQYIFGLVGINLMFPVNFPYQLYYRGCPQNIRQYHPQPFACQMMTILFLIQATILYYQNKYSPRFFIPKLLIPGFYQYQLELQINIHNTLLVKKYYQINQCVICMKTLDKDPDQIDKEDMYFDNMKKLKRKLWKTPCDHYFHINCLKRWIKIKLQCPCCRMKLPSP